MRKLRKRNIQRMVPNLRPNRTRRGQLTMLVRIIGGGPIGGYMAYKLAKNNIPIHLHEQGDGNNPERCTGLISTNLDKHIKIPKRLILNRIKGARISCGKTTLEIETPET